MQEDTEISRLFRARFHEMLLLLGRTSLVALTPEQCSS